MVLLLLGISLLTYMLVMNTAWASVIVLSLFALPISIYFDFNRIGTLKETFEYKLKPYFRLRKKLYKICKKYGYFMTYNCLLSSENMQKCIK